MLRHPMDKVCLFSATSVDKIFDNKGNYLGSKVGGPAYFITKAWKSMKIDYKDFTDQNYEVEIRLNEMGETGKVVSTPLPQKIDPSKLEAGSMVVISTIFKEWDISALEETTAKLFIDIQGFVRNARQFGAKEIWQDSTKLKTIFCLKGTKEEMKFLPKSVWERQMKRLLLVTDGGNGVELYAQGKKYVFPVSQKIKSSDTIGVGDTFFGYFIGNLYLGKNMEISINSAMRQAEEFLIQKGNEH